MQNNIYNYCIFVGMIELIAKDLANKEFDSYQSLILQFPNNYICIEYLEKLRWGNTPVCPRCYLKYAKSYSIIL